MLSYKSEVFDKVTGSLIHCKFYTEMFDVSPYVVKSRELKLMSYISHKIKIDIRDLYVISKEVVQR